MPRFHLLVVLGFVLASLSGADAQIVDPQHPEDPAHGSQVRKEFECRDCHACESPTPTDPCLAACPRHGSHFFGKHGFDEGPDIVVIDQLADLYSPVVFAHKLHAQMSDMTGGCENCHHYSETTGEIPPCRECHDAERNPVDLRQPALKGAYHRQCMNCHRDWSHENACGFCHEQVDPSAAAAEPDPTDIVGIPHPAIEATPTYIYETSYEDAPLVTFHHHDHVDIFGQQCVDCHRGDSCSRCHDPQATQTAHLDHLTTCCSCHSERDCGFCHATETQPRFDHAISTGWNLAPFHDELECSLCHGEPSTFRTPQNLCISCHIHWEVGSFDHAVTGLTLDEDHIENDCDSCHLDMDFSVQPSCEGCHDEPMLPDLVPGKLRLHGN